MHTHDESSYNKILEECISLVEKATQNEQKQIGLALEIGKKINQLVTGAEDGDATLKKLARDIFRARGKLVPPSRLYEYHQLYLNFGSMETIKSIADKSLNDISVNMLLKIPEHPKEADKVNDPRNVDHTEALVRVIKLLARFETKLEGYQLNEEKLVEVVKSLETIRDKTDSVLNAVREHTVKSQMDLFTGRKGYITSEEGERGE